MIPSLTGFSVRAGFEMLAFGRLPPYEEEVRYLGKLQLTSVRIAEKGERKVKSIKMLGLAALAALMAMAFVGASSAMAEETQLCKQDTAVFNANNEYVATNACTAAVESIHITSAGKAKLLTEPEVRCNVLFKSTSVGALANPQIINGHFTYTNCGCTVQEAPGTTAEIRVSRIGHETANVTGEAEIEVTCFGIECTYKGGGNPTAKGPLLSANPNGEVFVALAFVPGEGFFCPPGAWLDITMAPAVATYIAR